MSVPTPVILALTSLSLCVLNVLVFPELLPDTKLSSLFLYVTGVLFSGWIIWMAWIYPTFYSPLRHLPKPKSGSYPLIGHPRVSLRNPRAADDMLKMISETPNDGLIRIPGFLNASYLLPTDPSTLADVLVHKSYDFEKPTDLRKFLRIILGDGMVLVEGDEHKFQRKHVSPAFSFRHIRELIPIFWSKAVDLKGRIAAEIYENPEPTSEPKMRHREGIIEVNHWATKVTMDVIGLAGLGRDFNTLYASDDELVASYEEILEPTAEKAAFFAANLFFSAAVVNKLPWKLNQRLRTLMETLRGACRQLIQERRESKASEKEGLDILSLLIKSNNFADDMLVDQLLTFLAAGHETTSSSLTWATYLLAKHPETQNRLREEIRAALPSPSAAADPNFDLATVLESLPLLHGICNETLRLYPPVPTTVRFAIRDTMIGNEHIPAGTKVYLSPWGINRSPHLWENASEFVPERWIDPETWKPNNNGGVKSNYANMTFLHGPRSCIGEKFARSELKALMAVMAGTFQMNMADPNEKKVPGGVITSKPKNGMRLKMQVVDGW
ncbi:related to isotrichodermin C-15 hydroxylase (cytochrome P-450 monooxygenase CYP65A1) [Phialocephala subalpina]|uniref:Related to isotrichodermin C-15 hydroxylase (Cytochrome P-450 monooxygenase CYP65A1) n=1 Tax=Phialocephala subalpina TaxID=576137 RepID=A0A1L7WQP4_9HELO|nr:related to isotrichodermin C-15 hydroxylase (cytochrome P-450 monooxygenase CYP65A1) [Phialocephala subalpina]